MDDIVKEAREAIAASYAHDSDNRLEMIEDMRFVAGDQWSEQAKAERAGRPIVTINRSQQFLRQVANPIRQNMPTLKVEPDGKDDMEGAEVINGLFRRIQYNSSAAHVYATAVEHMVACGIGWFRVVSDYLDDESFDQELMIKRIVNPLSVYPDPGSVEPDRSDMSWCVVSEMIPRDAFKAKYPGASVQGMDAPMTGGGASLMSWGTSDGIRVAEYWRRVESKRTIFRLQDGTTADASTYTKRGMEYLKANGMIAGSREVKAYTTEMYLVSGVEVLTDKYECPCKWIPIVPVIGSEVPLENGVYRSGLIRSQREPGQLQNYFLSVAAESLGQQPKAPYMVTAKMIGKFKSIWDDANRKATPYLPYEADPDAPGAKPERIAPPPLPAGLVQMAQLMADEQKAATGIYDAALGAKSNETSGVAIQGRIEQGNQATSHFVDNLEHSLEHTGRILLDMIPKIYDTARTIRMKAEDGTETEARINTPVMNYDGQQVVENDLSQMKFSSVRVVMGPSYASRRQEAVQVLTQLIQAMPQVGIVAGDIIARNLDFDGAEELATRLRATLPPQVLAATDPEAAQQMAPPPDPMAEAQMQGQQAVMNADVEAAQARTAQEKAKADQELHRVDGVKLDNALKFKKLNEPPPQPNRPDGASPPN